MLKKEKREAFLQEIFCENPEEAAAAYKILSKMRNGEYDREFLKLIIQKLDDDYDITDAFYFGKILMGIIQGEIYSLCIQLGECPSKDKRIEENIKKLKSIPSIFEAKFDPTEGSGENSDGIFSWKEKLVLTNNKGEEMEIEIGEAPLEVGYTEACTSFFHLYTIERSLARWAYDENSIYLFVKK